MKFTIEGLKLGDRLRGVVQECLSGNDLIISFSGDLLRVHNQTRQKIRAGDTVTVVVSAVSPLKFQLLGEDQPPASWRRRNGRIDTTI